MRVLIIMSVILISGYSFPEESNCGNINRDMISIPSGSYRPLYSSDSTSIEVAEFMIDKYAVTNKEYADFLEGNARWQKDVIKKIFADENYLRHWDEGGGLGKESSVLVHSPVTNISWFAAKAFCECQGKRLPSVDEWEYVAMSAVQNKDGIVEEDYNQYILDWYSKPTPRILAEIGSTFENELGVFDMHGLIWEWVLDFNTAFVTGESRGDTDLDRTLYCASGAVGAVDLRNYAAFMRYGFRSSLQARYNIQNLGFRCVKEINK